MWLGLWGCVFACFCAVFSAPVHSLTPLSPLPSPPPSSPTSSCASNEVYGLRKVFGDDFQHLLILNTKGFTGHPMGVSFEDVVAAEVLVNQVVPPIANFDGVDPNLEMGGDLKMSRGGSYPCKYAMRFAAGFGSHIALALYGR